MPRAVDYITLLPEGKPGPMPANYGEWDETIEYVKDDLTQPFVWKVDNGKKRYYLLVTKKSKGDNPYLNTTQGNGDIWRYEEKNQLFLARKIQADEIDVDSLVAKHVKTANKGPRIIMSGSEMQVFGMGEHPNIIFGVDINGYAVLSYYSNEGELLYDLGPKGIDWNSIEPSRWNSVGYMFLVNKPANELTSVDVSEVIKMHESNNTIFYKWYAGSNPTVSEEDREKEKYIYKIPEFYSNMIDDGWYVVARSYIKGERPVFFSQNTGKWIKPKEKAIYLNPMGVKDVGFIYYEIIFQMSGGKIVDEYYVMWNGDENGNQIWP